MSGAIDAMKLGCMWEIGRHSIFIPGRGLVTIKSAAPKLDWNLDVAKTFLSEGETKCRRGNDDGADPRIMSPSVNWHPVAQSPVDVSFG